MKEEEKNTKQDVRKRIVAILKSALFIRRQKTSCKRELHAHIQRSFYLGKRRILCPRDGHDLMWNVQIKPRTKAKDLVKMFDGAVKGKYFQQTLYCCGLKSPSVRKRSHFESNSKGLQFANVLRFKDFGFSRFVFWWKL